MTQGKVWGSTTTVRRGPGKQLEWLTLEPQGESSWHYHRLKWNGFYCVTGVLIIEVDRSLTYGQKAKGGYGLIERTILTPGQYTEVPPGVQHRMVTEADGATGWEDYWMEDAPDDIVRANVGRSRKGDT